MLYQMRSTAPMLPAACQDRPNTDRRGKPPSRCRAPLGPRETPRRSAWMSRCVAPDGKWKNVTTSKSLGGRSSSNSICSRKLPSSHWKPLHEPRYVEPLAVTEKTVQDRAALTGSPKLEHNVGKGHYVRRTIRTCRALKFTGGITPAAVHGGMGTMIMLLLPRSSSADRPVRERAGPIPRLGRPPSSALAE